jgi:DNA-binding NtrC family response regulator
MILEITALIIEDSIDDFLLLKELLDESAELKVRFLHADRLENGLILATGQPVDVAVIDLSLPDSFGLATFERFHRQHPQIPTVIMTGHKDHGTALEAVSKGAQEYLFKGEPSATAITRTIRFAIERQRLMTELQTALEHVKQLQGYLPICANCKKIRDDQGYWNQIETYIANHSEAKFTHGICPECVKKLYPLLEDEVLK